MKSSEYMVDPLPLEDESKGSNSIPIEMMVVILWDCYPTEIICGSPCNKCTEHLPVMLGLLKRK